MSKIHHVIYLPGLGDRKGYGQPKLIKQWKKSGLKTHYHKVGWAENEPYATKLESVINLIDVLAKDGAVSLVGVSAGASAAVNAYWARKDKVAAVVFICGKLNNFHTVGQNYYHKNPPLKDSFDMAAANVKKLSKEDTAKMLSIRPLYDQTVPVRDQIVPGAKNLVIPVLFDVPAIFMAITIFRRPIIKFLKFN